MTVTQSAICMKFNQQSAVTACNNRGFRNTIVNHFCPISIYICIYLYIYTSERILSLTQRSLLDQRIKIVNHISTYKVDALIFLIRWSFDKEDYRLARRQAYFVFSFRYLIHLALSHCPSGNNATNKYYT